VDFYLIGGGETAYALPIQTGSWQSVDIPLSDFSGVDLTQVIQFKFDAQTAGDSPTMYIDNLYFHTVGGGGVATEPSDAPDAPTASDTISIFSDAYTDVTGVDTNPGWGQTTVTTTESVASNDVLKMAGLTFQGIDFGGARDVSGHDTVHIDFWTADATAVDFYLIGGGETAYALPIQTGSWQSVDIPLSDFSGVDLTQVIQFKFDA
ncbi:MAG: hypothetical protein GY934_02910, partial [Gammaproteobacteria bacterium]|nr:hypothetical protein [Gammaproteobacteria bacterium]